MTKNKMQEIIKAIVAIRDSLTNEQALNALVFYPDWKTDESYTAGKKVVYQSALYTVTQEHVSGIDKAPDVAVDLFTKVTV